MFTTILMISVGTFCFIAGLLTAMITDSVYIQDLQRRLKEESDHIEPPEEINYFDYFEN